MAENSAKRARKPKVKAPSAPKVTKKQPKTKKGSKTSAQTPPSQELEETGPIASSSRTLLEDDNNASYQLQLQYHYESDNDGRADVNGAFDTGFGHATAGDDALNGTYGNFFGTTGSRANSTPQFGTYDDFPASPRVGLSLAGLDYLTGPVNSYGQVYHPTPSTLDQELPDFGFPNGFEDSSTLSSGGGDAFLAHGPGSYDALSNNVTGHNSYDYGADLSTHGIWADTVSQGFAVPWTTDASLLPGNSVETDAATPSNGLWSGAWGSTTNTTPDAAPSPTGESVTVPTSEEATLAKEKENAVPEGAQEAESIAQATSSLENVAATIVSEPAPAPKEPTEPAEKEQKDTKGQARATEAEEPAAAEAAKPAEAPATKPKVDKGKGRARDVDPAPSNEPSSAPKKGTKGKGKAKGKGKGKMGAADVEATTAGEASTSSQTAAAASSSATVVPANTAPTRARAGEKKRRATGDDEDEAAAQPAKRKRKTGWDQKKTEWDSLALTVNPTSFPDSAQGSSTAGRLVPASEASSSTSAAPAPQAVRSGDYFYTFAPSPDLTVTATAASTSLNAPGTSSGQTATTAASSSTATGQVSSGRSQRSGGNGGSRAQDYTTYTFQLDRQDGNTVAGSSGSAAPSIQTPTQPYHPPGNY